MKLEDRKIATMLSEELNGLIRGVCHWESIKHSFESMVTYNAFKEVKDGFGQLPRLPMSRHTIYKATPETGGYSHHAALGKFGDTYLAIWSNGIKDEDAPGQQVYWSSSSDGESWSTYRVLAPNKGGNSWRRQAAGFYADTDHAIAYCNWFDEDVSTVDAFVTQDGVNWEEHSKWLEDANINEGPRLTKGGRLIAAGTVKGDVFRPAAFLFEGMDPLSLPKMVEIPVPAHKPRLFEPSWYQTDGGRIYMFFREETQSLRLYISWSDDEGESWSEAVMTDVPDSMAKFHNGRLEDGRFYLVGNSIPRLLDRVKLTILLGPDGESFDQVYTLVDEPTRRRIEGGHKEDGYQYPNTMVEGNKIYVIYSVNKEDVEVGIVNLEAIPRQN